MSLLSAAQLAKELGVSRGSVYRWGQQVPHVRLPSGAVRWELEAVRLHLETRGSNSPGMGRPRGSGSGSVREHRGAWEAQASVEGRRIARRFKSKAEALDWLAQVRLGQAVGTGKLTVAQVVERFIDRMAPSWKPASKAHHVAMLQGGTQWGTIHGGQDVTQVTRPQLQRWIDVRLKDYAIRTVRQEIRMFRELFRWALRERLIAADPSEGLRAPKVPRTLPRKTLTIDEVKALLDVSEPQWRIVWMLAVFQGLRREEIVRSTWDWVDLEGKKLHVLEGKTGQDSRPLAGWLAEELSIAGLRSGHLAKLQPNRINRNLTRCLKLAGIDDPSITPHTLRRTMATLLEFNGCPYGTIRYLLRHGADSVTGLYVLPDIETARPHLDRLVTLVRECKVTRLSMSR